MTPEEAIERAEEIEAGYRDWRNIGREMYRLGFEAGRQFEKEETDSAWRHMAARTDAPGGEELERLRWGEKGRSRFGDPRPGDYPGRSRTG